MNRFLKPTTYLFYLQRKVKSYRMRDTLAKLYGKYLGKVNITSKSVLGFDYSRTMVKELRENGCFELPARLPEKNIERIIEACSRFRLMDTFDPSKERFTIETAPPDTHVGVYSREDLITISSIMDIANDSEVLKIAQEFLGGKPTISNVNMWWSFAGHKQAKDAQLFHRDVDDIKFCKLFIYLTDVGPKDGPHTYVRGSSATNKLTKIRRYQDAEVTQVFGKENVIDFVRPKGSMFMVDTYGFHKGTLPIENDRLLLQVQYSLMPIWIENYKPAKNSSSNYHPYINRLLITS